MSITNSALSNKYGKLSELRQRLLFVLGALIVYRIGAHIPIPGVDPRAIQSMFQQDSHNILDMVNMFSGGALKRLSIFALGIMPYISASIILQLMAVVIPKLEQIKKEGESGRKKNQSIYSICNCFISEFSSNGCCFCITEPNCIRSTSSYQSWISFYIYNCDIISFRYYIPHVVG